MKKLYVVFYTTSEAMATEMACRENDIEGKLVSVPREISAGCGISYESIEDNFEKIKTLLENEDIEYEDIVLL